MSAGAETDVAVAQRGQFGDAQAGLDRHQQQGVITPAEPAGAVRRGEQRVDLVLVEEGDSWRWALGGMAITRGIDWACSGCRNAA